MAKFISAREAAQLIPDGATVAVAGMGLSGWAEELACAVTYGQQLGLAFQMVDDLLDVTGDERKLGKKTGIDAARGKLTWVAVRGLDGTRADAAAAAEAAKAAIAALNRDVSFFTALADQLSERTN